MHATKRRPSRPVLLPSLFFLLSCLLVAAPVAAERMLLSKLALEMAVYSEERAYACTTGFTPDYSGSRVVVREYALPSGTPLRTLEVFNGDPTDSLHPDVAGCHLTASPDDGAVLVTFTYVDSLGYTVQMVVVDVAAFTFQSAIRRNIFAAVEPVTGLYKVGSRYLLLARHHYLRSSIHSFASLEDLADTSVEDTALLVPGRPSHEFSAPSTDVAIDTSGPEPHLVVGTLARNGVDTFQYAAFFRLDESGVVDHATTEWTLSQTWGTSAPHNPTHMQVVAPPFFNPETEEYSSLVLGGVGFASWGGLYFITAVPESTGNGTVTQLSANPPFTVPPPLSFSNTMDALLYQGSDWIVASRDADTQALRIHRFPAAYAEGSTPVLPVAVDVDATFCGPFPGQGRQDEPLLTWSDNDYVQVQSMPSGLIAVAYASCTDPLVDPVLNVRVLDPAFPDSDLVVALSATPTPAAAGRPLVLTVVAANAGADANGHARVQLPLPQTLEDCSWSSVAEGGASGHTAGNGELLDTVALPPGATVTWTIACTVAADAAPGQLDLLATIDSPADEPTPGDNSHALPLGIVQLDIPVFADGFE